MPVEDTFSIAGRGTVATGRVEQGVIKVGEEIDIVGLVPTTKTICTGKWHLWSMVYGLWCVVYRCMAYDLWVYLVNLRGLDTVHVPPS